MSDVRDLIFDFNEDALFADGFDDAIIGIARRINMEPVVTYDLEKCANILVERDGMEYSDAVEYLEFNAVGAWMGEQTPIFIDTAIIE